MRLPVRIVVCDAGLGNLRSVERAVLEASRGARVDVEVTADPARIRAADRLIMPGQAGFRDFAGATARSSEMGQAVLAHLASGRPYLGICMGLQVLFDSSDEAPGCAGLGVLRGRVVKLGGGIDTVTGSALKIPHVGWNVAEPSDRRGLLSPGDSAEHYYFIHSYVVVPEDRSVVAATTGYGERFVSAVAYDNVFACQFHPEKSQRAGLALLERFLAS
jgi:glutamine amidotransferase